MPPRWCKLSLHPATKDKFVFPTEFPRDLAMRRRLTPVTKLCLSKKCHHIVRKAGWRYKCPLFFGRGGGAKPVEGITGGPFGLKSHCLTQERIQAGREPSYLALPGRRREGLAPDTSWASGWKISWIRVKISKKGTVTDAAALRERWCWPLPIPLISPNGRCLPMFIWPLPFTSCFSAVLFFFPDGNTMFRDKTDTKNNAKFV